jgi:hypothetical protein
MNSEHFQRGAKVTICSDAEGKHPRRVGIVKRIGNGAWRLGGCSEWYNFQGQRVAIDNSRRVSDVYAPLTCFAHPYREGDEARIEAESLRLRKRHELQESINVANNKIYWADYSINDYNKQIARNKESIAEAQRRLHHAEDTLTQTKILLERKEAYKATLLTELEQAKLNLELFDANVQEI